MYTCVVDPLLDHVRMGSVQFPLGVYPVESIDPKPGYAVEFESADGSDDTSDLEEWPDRFVFDIVISSDKLPALVLQLLAMMPLRLYPILDFLGHDDFREIDPYISYERMGVDQILDGIRQFRGFFYEDGMCGFGAMSEDPFFYLFVDEHKVVTVRVESALRERVVALLEAFNLQEVPEPVGVDAAAHEHRSVLVVPENRDNVLTAEEIVGYLRQEWHLTLNVNPDSNLDDEGNDIGVTGWRTIVRCLVGESGPAKYAEVLAWAGSISEAESLAYAAAEGLREEPGAEASEVSDGWADVAILAMDRLTDEHFETVCQESATTGHVELEPREPRIIVARWLE